VNKSGLPVADIVAKNTEPDIIGGIPPPLEKIKHEEPTVLHENVDLLEEILHLKEAVGILVETVPLTETERKIMKGAIQNESVIK
jgi:hypothetical protein